MESSIGQLFDKVFPGPDYCVPEISEAFRRNRAELWDADQWPATSFCGQECDNFLRKIVRLRNAYFVTVGDCIDPRNIQKALAEMAINYINITCFG